MRPSWAKAKDLAFALRQPGKRMMLQARRRREREKMIELARHSFGLRMEASDRRERRDITGKIGRGIGRTSHREVIGEHYWRTLVVAVS